MPGLHSRAEPDIAPELTRPLPGCNSWTAGRPALRLAGLGLCTSGWDLWRGAAAWEKGQHGAGPRHGLGHFCRVTTGHDGRRTRLGTALSRKIWELYGGQSAPPPGACSVALPSDELHGGTRGKSRGRGWGDAWGDKPGTPRKPHAWGRLISS